MDILGYFMLRLVNILGIRRQWILNFLKHFGRICTPTIPHVTPLLLGRTNFSQNRHIITKEVQEILIKIITGKRRMFSMIIIDASLRLIPNMQTKGKTFHL